MRFHIGFSKRIRFKTLIQFLGFLFVGLLAFLGLTDHAFAWTNVSFTSSTFSNGKNVYLSSGDNFNTPQTESVTITYENGSYGRRVFFGNSTSSPLNKLVFAKSLGLANSSYYYNGRISMYSTLDYSSSNYSCAVDNTLKSIDIEFPFYIDNYKNDLAFFNQSNRTDLFRIIMTAHSGDNIYPTTCSVTGLDSGDNSYYYLVNCNNVFRGSTEYPVSSYTITIENIVPFNDRYSDSTENKGIVYYWELGNNQYSFTRTYNINYQLRYECNDNPPVIDNPGGGEDDPNGLDDIYSRMQEDYNENVEGFDTGLVNLDLPSHFTDLLTMPLDVIQAVVDNSSVCSPATIDFSSIIRKWGNPNGTYILTLPCMRSVMNNLLGGIYVVCDVLLAAIVFYNVIMNLIQLVDAITSGEDLYSYFFKRTDQKGDTINHKTGEVG